MSAAILEAVAYLSAMTTGWNDDSSAAYALELREVVEDDHALFDAVRKIARSWEHAYRPSLGVIVDAYHHEVAVREADRRAALARRAVVRCGGDAFVQQGDEKVPCPTCNPALYKVWTEPGLFERWKLGESTWRLLGFADRKDDEYRAQYEVARCAPDSERTTFPSIAEGRAIAARECVRPDGTLSPLAARLLDTV